MRANLHLALKLTAGSEGGFSNHPKDPGGATMKGVTLKTYTAYRQAKGLARPTISDLKRISDSEVEEIFTRQYWAPVHGDELPAGLDIIVADMSFNSGGGQAVKELQRVVTALGFDTAGADGKFGDHTRAAIIAAMRQVGEDRVINAYQDKRLAFMQSLSTWPTFKGGWTTRVKEMRANGLNVAHGDPTFQPTPVNLTAGGASVMAKAEPTDTKTMALAGAKPILTAIGGTIAAGATSGAQSLLANTAYAPPSYMIYAVGGFLVLTAVAGGVAYFGLRGKVAEEGTV